MLILGSAAVSQDIALLITLLGIGVVVNALVIYIVGEVFAERRQNQERRERGSSS